MIRDRFAAVSSSLTAGLARVWPVLSSNGRFVAALSSTGGANGTGTVVVLPNPL
ncbi:MAG TPA: hypothetical protein VH165_09715 [Kofleriaceae bacterium]|nr:hypothetical protein [Kofleriaceae bacterium]